ncbi:N-acetylmuramoyl-L-alanine amidase [Desulfohalotomaculum tongense]|uniref:N-acetylmuramoyl-L-alanine amidase family protein n=1 Tax=Desulforadius tongensis TaxID=1216062 RepID=UPI00195A91F2|nr:N-acetylmuramoyl-L-alanine amidase [Desulforadius tongensis]MBM7855815.1 N-acetylmuramoyl-L-alanine amidase [Desulforadius tongensis]
MSKKTIVIDPGHGGRDPGAVGYGLTEKEINLDIARKVSNYLKKYTAEIHLTRNNDIYVSLTERANIANRFNADYFISIHSNAGRGSGFESYIHTTENPVTAELQRVVHNKIMDYLSTKGIRNRGTKSANFTVLRETNMPALLVENLFIDNPSEVTLLKDEKFRSGLAEATANGIAKALSLTVKETADPPYDSAEEINKLKEAGLINSDHPPESNVSWGEFAAVINRLLEQIK